ncbi:unnamed protein product [Arctogadus glacialis]
MFGECAACRGVCFRLEKIKAGTLPKLKPDAPQASDSSALCCSKGAFRESPGSRGDLLLEEVGAEMLLVVMEVEGGKSCKIWGLVVVVMWVKFILEMVWVMVVVLEVLKVKKVV